MEQVGIGVAEVFAILDKVFSGEMLYDDAFMSLDLHAAKVRKEFPHLYEAMKSKNGDQKVEIDNVRATATVLRIEEAIKKLEAATVGARLAPSVEQNSGPPLTSSEAPNIYGYTQWVKEHFILRPASSFKEGEEWMTKWDAKNKDGVLAPPPTVGQTWTLKNNEGYRVRFQVANAYEDADGSIVHIFRFITVLQNNS